MNQWMISACCLFPIFGYSNHFPPNTELESIEQRIQILQERLQQSQLIEIKEDVEAQRFMIANWEAYSQEIQELRQLENEEEQIQLQIKELEQRKAQLLQQVQPK